MFENIDMIKLVLKVNPTKGRHFRLVQTESTSRLQNFEDSRKHFGKGRKCRLPAFSPFPKMFSKAFPFRVV